MFNKSKKKFLEADTDGKEEYSNSNSFLKSSIQSSNLQNPSELESSDDNEELPINLSDQNDNPSVGFNKSLKESVTFQSPFWELIEANKQEQHRIASQNIDDEVDLNNN